MKAHGQKTSAGPLITTRKTQDLDFKQLVDDPLIQVEERNTGAVTWTTYKRYFASAGGLVWVPIIFSLLIIYQACQGMCSPLLFIEIFFDSEIQWALLFFWDFGPLRASLDSTRVTTLHYTLASVSFTSVSISNLCLIRLDVRCRSSHLFLHAHLGIRVSP